MSDLPKHPDDESLLSILRQVGGTVTSVEVTYQTGELKTGTKVCLEGARLPSLEAVHPESVVQAVRDAQDRGLLR